jgi:hypothetical protein
MGLSAVHLKSRRIVPTLGVALLLAANPAHTQELTAPAAGLSIAWRSPASATMPTVTWTVTAVDGVVATMRTEARALFERLTTEGTIYRVLFPLRNVDQFGTLSEFEYDRAQLDEIGRLDVGKSVRIAVKSVTTIIHPQTKRESRTEATNFMVITVERHEVVTVPAGKFDAVVIRLEAEGPTRSPAVHQVVRRYWYAPAIGWYVRHEVVMTGPAINQHNEYVAVKITPLDASAQRR